MPQAAQANIATTPYEMIGGASVIRSIVNRFYDLMETDPAYADLRALHATNLGPMRASLAGFLTAWSGGARDWFNERPGACIMSAHRKVPINSTTRDQWMHAMRRAAEEDLQPRFAGAMMDALGHMATAMINDE